MGTIYLKKEFHYTYTFGFSFYKEFLWNTGNLSPYWYQVTGCCKDTFDSTTYGTTGCPPFKTDSSSCENKKSLYFQTLLAYSVEDLCQQITNNNWNWELCSIKKWSRPAENLYSDPNNDCNILQEVNFKNVPECISLSVSENPSIKIIFNMFITPHYNGSGVLSICKSGCSATYSCSTEGCCPTPVPTVTAAPVSTPAPTPTATAYDYSFLDNIIMDDDLQSLNQIPVAVPNIIVNCSQCTTVPARLYCKNNLLNLNYFSNFIYNKNKEEFNSNFEITYSKYSDSWKKNYYYDEKTSNSSIKWYVYFDLACFNNSETNYYWKFLMMFRKIENNVSSDTKLVITIPSEFVCGYNSEFNFNFNFDVVKKQLFTNINYFRDDFIFYDKIGLFTNDYWKKNTEFFIRITQNYDPNLTTRKTITY